MTPRETRPCKACGKKLLFVRDEHGKLHPLDAEAPVWVVIQDLYGNPTAVRAANSYVTHFATCPSANEFSKGRSAG
jgi:hypothetical protein